MLFNDPVYLELCAIFNVVSESDELILIKIVSRFVAKVRQYDPLIKSSSEIIDQFVLEFHRVFLIDKKTEVRELLCKNWDSCRAAMLDNSF